MPSLTALGSGVTMNGDLGGSMESLNSLRTTPVPGSYIPHRQQKQANCYARALARVPYVIALVSLIAGASCGCVFKYHGLPDFKHPTAGFEARGTYISGASRTMNLLYYHDTGFSLSPNVTLVQEDFNFTLDNNRVRNRRASFTDQAAPPISETCAETKIYANAVIKIVFESSDGSDLYNAKAMRAICEMENKYVTNILETECRLHSLPFYIATLHNKCCQELREEDMKRFRERLDLCVPYYLNQSLTEFCGSSDKCPYVPDACTTYNAIYKVFHYITDLKFHPNLTYFSNDTFSNITHNPLTYTMMIFRGHLIEMSIVDYYKNVFDHNHLDNGIVKISGFYEGEKQKFELFDEDMLSDMRYFILAGVLILVMLWLYLHSFWLMIATLVNVTLSGVTAYFTYFFIMGVTFFPFMNVLAILILIAVGADDVFIFFDTWQQVNITDKDKPLALRIEKTFKHAALSIFVTSLTTGAAFFSNFVSSITAIRCFGLFAGLAVLSNFVFMMTWTPSIIIILDYAWNWITSHINLDFNCSKRVAHITWKASTIVYGRVLPWLIEKLWFIWIITSLLGGILGAIAIFWKPGLQLPKSSQFQLFPLTNLMENFDQNLADKFAFHDVLEEIHVSFVWGFTGDDLGDKLDPDDDGKVKLSNFNLTNPESQMWLQRFCQEVRQQDFIDSRFRLPNYKCFLEVHELRMQALCENNPPHNFEVCCHNTTPPYDPSVFEKCLPLGLMYSQLSSLPIHPVDAVIFDEMNHPIGYAIRIKTNQPFSTSYEVVDTIHKKVESYFTAQLATAPSGAGEAFFTGQGYFKFYDLQRAIGSGTFYSIALSLAVAFGTMFLTSLNLLITLYALITISLAIAVTIGCIVVMGWPLGILESVTISLAVGLSIDFTIHYGVAYRLSQETTQVKRVYESFTRVGSAVAMAALTTFTAGASVMPSSILAYTKLGTFLMLVMTFSWWYATFFFMSVCRVLGPRTTFCQIKLPFSKHRSSSVPENHHDQDTDAELDENLLYDHQVWNSEDINLLVN